MTSRISVALTLAFGCSYLAAPDQIVVRYVAGRPVSVDLRRLGEPDACVNAPRAETSWYRYPNGSEFEFEEDQTNEFTLEIEAAEIGIARFVDRPEAEVFVANAELEQDQMRFATTNRSRLRFCTLLIYVDGDLVGIDENGSDWSRAVPLGVFRSRRDAQGKLGGRHRIIVERADRDVARNEAFWKWRQSMDLWEYACDPEVRRAVDAMSPKEALRWHASVEGIDCNSPPPVPPE